MFTLFFTLSFSRDPRSLTIMIVYDPESVPEKKFGVQLFFFYYKSVVFLPFQPIFTSAPCLALTFWPLAGSWDQGQNGQAVEGGEGKGGE